MSNYLWLNDAVVLRFVLIRLSNNFELQCIDKFVLIAVLFFQNNNSFDLITNIIFLNNNLTNNQLYFVLFGLNQCISIKESIPMLICRNEVKKHGTKQMIEGVWSKDQTCIIVEDVVTSGGSIGSVIEVRLFINWSFWKCWLLV